MKLELKKIFKIFLLGAFVYTFLLSHELVHSEIFRLYGVDSKIKISWWGGTTTPSSDVQHLTKEETNQMQFLHALNEVVGYQLFACFSFLFAFLLLKD